MQINGHGLIFKPSLEGLKIIKWLYRPPLTNELLDSDQEPNKTGSPRRLGAIKGQRLSL